MNVNTKIIFFILGFLLIVPSSVKAVCTGETACTNLSETACTDATIDLGINCSWSIDGGSTNTVTIPDPLGNNGDINLNEMIGTALNGLMGVIGSIALLMFVYGGFVWMTAAGSSEKVKKGKDVLVWATIGIFVIFASYGLVTFILKAISGK